MNILEIKHLNKLYDNNRGIKDVNMVIKEGTFHAFIGENGAGKTTTIKSIIGSYINYDGEILINGISTKKPESKSNIGYVPEVTIFPKELTTYQYLKYLAQLNNVDKAKIDLKIDEMLNKFNIMDLKNKKPYSFSSGQKKKVLLIQALIHDPKLVILDEPSANLDPSARFELFSILSELRRENKTIIISTHVLSEVDKYADSLTLIHKGKILYNGQKTKNLEDFFYEKVIQN